MKLTSLEVLSENVSLFEVRMEKVPTRDKFLLKASSGLDADEIVRKFVGFGKLTKPKFYTSTIPKRDVVLRIQLNPDYAVNESFSDVRNELYRAISLNQTGVLDLLFKSGGSVVSKLTGFIKKLEAPLSSETPEVQLTIQCIDPLYRGINPVVITPTEISPLIIGDNVSNAPHGFSMVVEFLSSYASFELRDKLTFTEWSFKVEPIGGFTTGDTLYINSEFGNTDLYMFPSGSDPEVDDPVPLMDAIVPGSSFPVIYPKNNTFWIPFSYTVTILEIKYHTAYWGV